MSKPEKDQAQLDAEDLAIECRKAVRCLYLELPESITEDVSMRLETFVNAVAAKLRESDDKFNKLKIASDNYINSTMKELDGTERELNNYRNTNKEQWSKLNAAKAENEKLRTQLKTEAERVTKRDDEIKRLKSPWLCDCHTWPGPAEAHRYIEALEQKVKTEAKRVTERDCLVIDDMRSAWPATTDGMIKRIRAAQAKEGEK